MKQPAGEQKPNQKLLTSAAVDHPRQSIWPFDRNITKLIFSFLPFSAFPNTALTCGFFYMVTKIHAEKILDELCKQHEIDRTLLVNAAPHILLQLIEIFTKPIAVEVGSYRPKITKGSHFVRRDCCTWALCRKKETSEVCFIGTFARSSTPIHRGA